MIAQDFTKHPGSIIRINLDGSVPMIILNLIIKKIGSQKFIKLACVTLKGCHFHHLIIKFIYLTMELEEEIGLEQRILEKTMVGKS